MLNNWPVPACSVCDDLQRVRTNNYHSGSSACPACSDPGKRADMEVKAFQKNYAPPGIDVNDLQPKEYEFYAAMVAQGVNGLQALRWIEGQRYEPIGDAEFLKEIAKQLKPETVDLLRKEHRAWKASRNTPSSSSGHPPIMPIAPSATPSSGPRSMTEPSSKTTTTPLQKPLFRSSPLPETMPATKSDEA